jgi:GWxTD domain-containing protein
MKTHLKNRLNCILLIVILVSIPLWGKTKKIDPWKDWIKEVDIIITRSERSVAKLLATVEERDRFKKMFWKARDPNSKTPRNEYKIEYFRRVAYANKSLRSVKSDRGRIYILLGEPHNKTSFVGHQDLVECELWSYQSEDRPGLMPFMNLIFFRPRNMGDYQLYHPGIHNARDLMSPNAKDRNRGVLQAHKQIKMNSAELASASISIIPGEGDPRIGLSLSSSNFALNRIYELPEKEAELGYIRSFRTPTGSVEVSHSTRAIRGFGTITVTRNKGLNFVHYALMPDILNLKQVSQHLYNADIHLHINIETLNGTIIYQNLRTIDFKADQKKRAKLKNRKIVFRDFAPIIEGTYNVVITYINNSTKEFFNHNQQVTVSNDPKSLAAVVGYQIKEIQSDNFIPFAADNYLVLTDPRSNFSQKDAVAGLVYSSQMPQVYLQKTQTGSQPIAIDTLSHEKNVHKFHKPLSEVKDGTYLLTVKLATGERFTRKIYVLPFYIEITRPFVMEKPEPRNARYNYLFVRAQQYLHVKKTDLAIADFNKIPKSLRNASSLPLIAKAYYIKGDYNRVVALLEREDVQMKYATLLLLANSSIELKRFPKALEYLQQIRKYGDTVEINHLLAATYLSMGDRQNARAYYERARKIKTAPINTSESKKTKNKKIRNNK